MKTQFVECEKGSERLSFGEVPGVYVFNDGELTQYSYIGDKLPWRVRNRLLLHQMGVCQMFTVLIGPNPCCMKNEDMIKIADQAEVVNRKIGLPVPVDNLIVRTRDVSATTRMAGSNPILVMSNIRSGHPRYMQLQTDYSPQREFAGFEEWHESLPVSMYCMIHEENPQLQKRSLHGRVMQLGSDQSWEVSLGTHVLHARMIGQNESKYVGMGGHDLDWLFDNVEMGNMMSVLDMSSASDARKLVARTRPYVDQIKSGYDRVARIIGKNSVLEFRIYDIGGVGLQVYDFDKEF